MNFVGIMELQPEKESPKKNSLVMWCECCEKPFKRWYIDIVEPEDIACEVNVLIREKGEQVESNFCCAQCCTELVLKPLQTEAAKKFRRVNEQLRMEFEPTVIN